MNYIPFMPLFRFIRIVVIYGGLSVKNVFHLAPWLLKVIILEPLRWIEVMRFENRINRTRIIHPPVFILGHYRSGTTFMQRIFTHDSRFGSMSLFQQNAPELMLLFEKPLTKIIQWVSDLFRVQNQFHRVPSDWSYPGEEDIALMAMMSEYSPTWGFLFPRKFNMIFPSYFQGDTKRNEKWEQDYLYLLKKLTLKNQGKPLILKSPPHTARVKALLELFPQARFVYISRDSCELFSSTGRLWDVVKRFHSLGPTAGVEKDELIYSSIEIFRNQWREDQKLLQPDKFIEIDYKDLLHHPLDVVHQIYSKLQLPDFLYCEPAIRQFLETQKNYKTLTHVISQEVKSKIASRCASDPGR